MLGSTALQKYAMLLLATVLLAAGMSCGLSWGTEQPNAPTVAGADGMEATLAALAAQNAQLATQVAALETRTAVPTAMATPSATSTPIPPTAGHSPAAPTATRAPSKAIPTATPTPPSTATPDVVYHHPIPLNPPQANAGADLSMSPSGDVILGGIPFRLSGSVFKSQAATPFYATAPTSLLLEHNVPHAYRLYLLLNTGNGFNHFAGQTVGQVIAHCDGVPMLIALLRLGQEIREWHAGDNVISTAAAQQVWSAPIAGAPGQMGYIDMLNFALPAECQNGALTAVQIVDTSVDTTGSLDPAFNLFGVTVASWSPEPEDPGNDANDVCANAAEIPQAECQALFDLYTNTGGPNWRDSSDNNWSVTTSPCNWTGVTCSGGHVVTITCPGAKLSGVLPASLGDLTGLQHLDLFSNDLTGPIPPELGHLVHLEHLNLGNNDLSGPIPPELGNLTDIQTLWLFGNQLSGAIPPELGNLANLYELALNFNELSGAIPPELGNLTRLQNLNLYGNNLTGAIPPTLGNLANLRYLYLVENNLTGAIPPELSHLTHLTLLCLDDNALTGAIPPELGNLTDLDGLYLNNNHLTGAIPSELGNLTSLNHLYLYGNHLTGAIPSELGHLANLRFLYLSGNRLSGLIPHTISQLTALFCADLAYNGLWAQDQSVKDFLNSKNPNWMETQTAPPTEISVTQLTSATVRVSWQPISYTQDGGYYQVHYSLTPGGPYTLAGVTADKTVNTYVVDGLAPEIPYYFVVTAFTPVHANNRNPITSAFSSEVETQNFASLR